MLFYRCVTCHHSNLKKKFPPLLLFRVMRHKFSALKTCFNADMRLHCWRLNPPLSVQQSFSPFPIQRSSSTPAGGQPHPSPPSGYVPLLLVANLTPLHPALIFYPSCWQSNSPLSAQQSFSTSPARGQTLPSLSSSHPHPSSSSSHLPPLLVANLTPPHPVVMFHLCCWPTSPLPTQWSSSTHPAGSQTLPSQPSGPLLPILLVVKLSPLCPAVILTPPRQAAIFNPC